jgi:hypothetical protein
MLAKAELARRRERQVLLLEGRAYVAEELASLASEEEATTQQVTRRTHLGRIDEGDGKGAPPWIAFM